MQRRGFNMSSFFPESVQDGKSNLKSVLSHLGVLSATVTLLAVSALFFTDISLFFQASLEFSLHFLLLLFASYVMYFSLSETGAEQAKKEKEYELVLQRTNKNRLRFREEGTMASLSAFCDSVSERETQNKRKALLSAFCLTEEDLGAYGPSNPPAALSSLQKRGLRKVARRRAVRIAPPMLLFTREGGGYTAPLANAPAVSKIRRFLPYLFASAFTAFFSVSVICQIIFEPSPAFLLGYFCKIFTLVFNGIKGYRAGYCNISKDTVSYLSEQNDLLDEYFKDFLPFFSPKANEPVTDFIAQGTEDGAEYKEQLSL